MDDKDNAINTLKDYESELNGILARFQRTSEAIHIQTDDDPRFRQIAIELCDFLDDTIRENSYSVMISKQFNEGITNFYGSPSYKSVENIRGIVLSVITRIERNPEVLSAMKADDNPVTTTGQSEPEFPQKVTLTWLTRHVPISYGIAAVSLLCAAFVLGIQASRISIVKEIFLRDIQKEAGTSNTEVASKALTLSGKTEDPESVIKNPEQLEKLFLKAVEATLAKNSKEPLIYLYEKPAVIDLRSVRVQLSDSLDPTVTAKTSSSDVSANIEYRPILKDNMIIFEPVLIKDKVLDRTNKK